MNDLELDYQTLVEDFDSSKLTRMKEQLKHIQSTALPSMVKESLLKWFKKIRSGIADKLTNESILSLFDEPAEAAFHVWIFAQSLMDYQDLSSAFSSVEPIKFFEQSKHLRVAIDLNCPHVVLFFLNLLANALDDLSENLKNKDECEKLLLYIKNAYINNRDSSDGITHLILALVEIYYLKINGFKSESLGLSHIANATANLIFAKEFLPNEQIKIKSLSLSPEADSVSLMLSQYKFKNFNFDNLLRSLENQPEPTLLSSCRPS